MKVEIGNNRAVEAGYNDEGKLVLKPYPGEHVTRITFPPGTSPQQGLILTIKSLERHMEHGATPVWIESDDKQLRKLLVDYYGLQITKANRPDNWGQNGAPNEDDH